MPQPEPPPTWLALIEPSRLLGEFGGLLCSVPWLSRLPRGDGHAVITTPAFAADDSAMLSPRLFLERLACDARPWQLGFNCRESRCVENVPVHSSHVGLAVNPLVYRVVAERLALRE